MRHNEFFQAVKARSIAPVYLFEGCEEYIKETALQALEAALLPPGFEALNRDEMENPPASDIIAAVETLPFMADKRLIIVKGSTLLTGRASGDDKQAAARLKEYITHVPPTACLVFYVRGAADRKRALTTALEKAGARVQFDTLDESELSRWILQQFKKHGKTCDAGTAARMIFTVGRETTLLITEIHKAAAFAGEHNEITPADIEAVCTPSAESRVFSMIDALVAGRGAEALAMVALLQKNGEAPLGILALLLRQYRLMLMVKDMREAGVSQGEMSKKLGVQAFAIGRLLSQAARYTQEDLLSAMRMMTDTDYRFKSGQYSQQGMLEAVLLKLMTGTYKKEQPGQSRTAK